MRSNFLGYRGSKPFAFALFGLFALSQVGITESANAQTKPLQKVRMVVATGVLDVTYTEFTIPSILGYWKAEGYDVDVQPAGGSLQGAQQLVGGGAEIAVGSGNAFVSVAAKTNVPLRIAMTLRTSDWGVGVKDDGPIKSAKDLKGKTIGVFNLATGGILWLNELLQLNGFDPAKDVSLVPTGMGPTPVQALQAGRVDGLLYWGSALASFENAGLKMREIAGDDWASYPDYSVAVTQPMADKDPAMIIAVLRGIAKAATFVAANPACAIKLHWAAYPASKGPGDEALVLKNDMHSVERAVAAMDQAMKSFGQGKLRGVFDKAAWEHLIKFMVKTNQLDAAVSTDTVAVRIPDLVAKINDFDVKAIQDSAKACKV